MGGSFEVNEDDDFEIITNGFVSASVVETVVNGINDAWALIDDGFFWDWRWVLLASTTLGFSSATVGLGSELSRKVISNGLGSYRRRFGKLSATIIGNWVWVWVQNRCERLSTIVLIGDGGLKLGSEAQQRTEA
nr:hypothetical protein CFP56_63451 [Quercus suber]